VKRHAARANDIHFHFNAFVVLPDHIHEVVTPSLASVLIATSCVQVAM